MKIKYALLALCLALMMLLFAGCKKEDSGNTDTGGNSDNTGDSGDNSGDSGNNGGQNQECTHSFTDGVCVHCGENDPNYKPGGSDDGNGDQKPGEGETEPEVPPIDMGGSTELPFVPAK